MKTTEPEPNPLFKLDDEIKFEFGNEGKLLNIFDPKFDPKLIVFDPTPEIAPNPAPDNDPELDLDPEFPNIEVNPELNTEFPADDSEF
jgi:hypothetical protein